MKIMLPVIRNVDVLLVGGTVHACALALKLRQAGLTVFAVTPFSYFADDFCARLDLRPLAEGEEKDFFRRNWYDDLSTRTPMQLKHGAERRFADAGIDYLFQTHPVRLARDAAGRAAGLVVANRSGFQIIAARVIVDATPRELVARLAGAPCKPFAPGDYDVTLRVLGAAAENGNRVEKIQEVRDGASVHPLYKVTRRLRFDGNAPRDFAKADVAIRRAAWHPESLMLADICDVDLGDGVDAAYAPSADCPVALAARSDFEGLQKLLESCRPGAPVAVDAGAAKAGRPGETVRHDKSFRFDDCPAVPFDLNDLPGAETTDVLVVGGGTGGAPAAIAAARAGAKTVCVENLSLLGGISTAGMIGCYCFGNRVGFTTELDRGTAAMGEGRPTHPLDKPNRNIRWKAAWFLRECAAAGAEVYFNSLTVAAVVGAPDAAGRAAVAGAACATPWGLTAFAAKKCVDATGNNDLVAAAGGETTPLVAGEPAVQGAGLSPVFLGRDYVNSDFLFVCDSDVADATCAYSMARAKFLDRFDSAPILETRERRRVVGDLTLQPQDFFANRTYDDTVNIAYSNFDTHGFIVHPMFMLKPTDHTAHYAKVPYRAMLPRNLEGVLVTGLGMSAHRDCMPLIRMQPDVHNQGFAAGTAAAMAVKGGCGYRQIDMKALQRTLVEHEILPAAVLEEHDAIGEIAPDDTHYELARIFLEPEKARAEIHARYAEKPTVADAHVLAFLGDDCGRGALAQAVRDAAWDKGWNFTGMDQFGMSMSPLDSMLFALTQIGGDADAVLAKLHELRYEHDFSHIRAISMALLAHPDKRAAAPLSELLGAYGATGHATRTLRDVFAANREAWNDTETRNLQLKELYLAKALAACDPESPLARRVLSAYRASPNAYYAIFAAM